MSYVMKQECALEDGLLGGNEFPVKVDNVSLTSGATVERGMLLAGENGLYSLAGAGDVDKSLMIAAQDFTADSLNAVTQVYSAGYFNREKIILGESLTADTFEQSLRIQNIHLTSRR